MLINKVFKASINNDIGKILYIGSVKFMISGNEKEPVVNGLFAAKEFKPEVEMQSVILEIPKIHTGKIQLKRNTQNDQYTVFKIFFDHPDWFTNPDWLAKIIAE